MSEPVYDNPLISRYASREMAQLFSTEHRIRLWRELWIVLAETEKDLGLAISDSQIAQLKAFRSELNLEVANAYERKLRHDVMAQVHAYGDQCPDARGIIHLGATSCYVTDNSDLMMMRDALRLVRRRLRSCLRAMAMFARQHAKLPCLAFTHLQPAQPTTVGKRATLWMYDLVLDLEEIEHRLESLKARSAKGTTGTQASFLQLFDGDHAKVRELERRIAEKIGFSSAYAVTGQTYSRKVDAFLLDTLAGVAVSVHKLATDLRLLANRKEIEEPFEEHQIGSSAMAYKRNPMRSERMCSLARFVMSLQTSPSMTAATQWFERTLDDSANRRLVIPQAFLAVDACLVLLQNVTQGLVVYPKTIEKNLREELPFMATESLLMAGVAAGGDRQHLHEVIRVHSQAAANRVKQEGLSNDLLERLASDPAFAKVSVTDVMAPEQYVGRAVEQVAEFLEEVVAPLLDQSDDDAELSADVRC
ncbi:MAG: adenylosuccinate lyase [Pirellula sp.]|jgi:adenylosuccinate lyase|nr:adenylosuccinate lyase [Pirellula sp.]